MNLNLSITKRMLLFITVPMLIEGAFLVMLLQQFQELQNDLEAEAHAVDELVLVNRILTGAMTAVGNLGAAKVFNQPTLYAEAMAQCAQVDELITQLKKSTPADGKSAISGFLTVIEQTQSMFEGARMDAHEDEFMVEGMKMGPQLKSFLRRVHIAGSKVIDEQTQLCIAIREKQKRARMNIGYVIETAAVMNLLLALGAVGLFGLTLGKRFRRVFDNAVLIAASKPLNPPLLGGDELSELDKVIHAMDRELVVTRRRERAIIDNTAEIICSLDHSFRVV